MLDAGYSIPETSTERRVSGIEGILELAVGSVRHRAKRLESVISICILAILFLIGVGVFVKQFNYDMGRFGIDTAAALNFEIQNSKIETAFELSSLVPAGFETASKIEVYNSENLYEKINGKAPFYIESGFEKLSTQRFVSRTDESLWMELFVYDMSTIRNAFSVYSVQRRAEAELFAPMRLAYKTGNALYFVHGRYYIELIGSSESGELLKAMAEVARKIRVSLAVDNDTEIAELVLFPRKDLVPESIKLYLANAFGFEKLTDTFTAKYRFGNQIVTAFLSKRADSKDAEAVAEDYQNFLIENGAVVKNAATEAIEAKVVDFYGTTEIIFTAGPFVAGIHEAEDQNAAEKVAQMLLNKLKQVLN
jgi:hypothetical protein